MATKRRTSGSAVKKPAARKPSATTVARHVADLEDAVASAAEKLRGDRVLREGSIVLRADSESAAGVVVRSGRKGVELAPLAAAAADDAPPLIEVIGDPRRIAAIVRGEKDARRQFLAGGLRVRGDMSYLSELGMRLGFLETPIG